MAFSDSLDLLQAQISTLFILDNAGDLRAVNEEATDLNVPYVFVGRTASDVLIRFRNDIQRTMRIQLVDLLNRGSRPGLDAAPGLTGDVCRLFEREGFELDSIWEGPAYSFAYTGSQTTTTIEIDESNYNILEAHFSDLTNQVCSVRPCVVVARNGVAVSACWTARRSNLAAECGVETAEGFRNQGFAALAVGAWAGLTIGRGLMPLYSTSFDNRASMALARHLGLVHYATDFHVAGATRK